MYSLKIGFILFVVCYSVSSEDCPCALQESYNYPGSQVWNCQNLGLTEVPGQCYEIQSENIAEFILSENYITEILNIDLAQLTDLRAFYFDANLITFFDASALLGINDLEIFYGAHNPNLELPNYALAEKQSLKEIVLTSSHILSLPNITSSTQLERVDIRSCGLLTLPRPTFGQLVADSSFLLTMVGNSVVDCAADILLPIPAGATINVDDYFIIWAADSAQKEEVINKGWNINVDLATNVKICGVDGTPSDLTMC